MTTRETYAICTGTPFETDVHVLTADKNPGAITSFIVGGFHGDEQAGYRAAESLSRASIPRGKLVVIPRANMPAIKADARNGDGPDMNRQSPANPNQKCTHQLARAIWTEVQDHDPDWVFDCHSSRGLSFGRKSPSNFDGFGQAVYTTQSAHARAVGQAAVGWTNEKFGLTDPIDGYQFDYRTNDSVGGTSPKLIHRAHRDGRHGAILESTEDRFSDDEQTDQLVCVLATAMKQFDQQPTWSDAESPADGASPDTPDSSMPQYPHKQSDLVQPTNTLRVSAEGTEGGTYRFRCAGKISPVTSGSNAIGEDTTVNYVAESGYSEINGTLDADEVESFRYDGALYQGNVTGGLSLIQNGTDVSLDEAIDDTFLKVSGKGSYTIRMSGGAAPGYTPSHPAETADTITEHNDGSATIDGSVSGGADIFYVSGDVVKADIPDGVTAELAGQAIESTPTYDHELKVSAVHGLNRTDYTVVVSGDATVVREGPGSSEGNESVSSGPQGTECTGWLTGNGVDTFRFNGEVLAKHSTVPSGISVKVDGEPVDMAPDKSKPGKGDSGAGTPPDGDGDQKPSDSVEKRLTALGGRVDSLGQNVDQLGERVTAIENQIGGEGEGDRFPFTTWNSIPSDRIYHAVEDLGADDSGGEPIDPIFAEAMGGQGHVAIWFPPGKYRLEGFAPTADAVELYGSNATIIVDGDTYSGGDLKTVLDFRSDRGVVDGFVFDFSETGLAPQLKFRAPNWRLRNCVVNGNVRVAGHPQHMEMRDNGVSMFHFSSTSKDGRAIVENLYARGMTDEELQSGTDTFVDQYDNDKEYTGVRDNRRAMWIPPANSQFSHVGTLEVKSSWWEHWVENTLYGEYAGGSMHIIDNYVRNSPIGLRTPNGSSIRGSTIIKDGPVPWMRESLWLNYGKNAKPGTNRMRGLMSRPNHYADDSLPYVVENCDFVFTDDRAYTMGQPIVMTCLPRKTTFKNVRIKLRQRNIGDADRHDRWPAIKVDGETTSVEGGEMVFDGVHIDSDSKNEPAIKLAQKANVTKFRGKISCPAGRIEMADGDVLDVTDNMDIVEPGEPDQADPTPPNGMEFPAPGETPDDRR